jgi:hypothetical protein
MSDDGITIEITTLKATAKTRVLAKICDTFMYACYSPSVCEIDNSKKCSIKFPKYVFESLSHKCYPYQIVSTILTKSDIPADDLKDVAGT